LKKKVIENVNISKQVLMREKCKEGKIGENLALTAVTQKKKSSKCKLASENKRENVLEREAC
jgi:hypothetical protein